MSGTRQPQMVVPARVHQADKGAVRQRWIEQFYGPAFASETDASKRLVAEVGLTLLRRLER
jgi:hypothetical protein